MSQIHSFEKDGYLVTIFQDETAENPRNWDPVGTISCKPCRRYSFGDEEIRSDRELLEQIQPSGLAEQIIGDPDEIAEAIYDQRGGYENHEAAMSAADLAREDAFDRWRGFAAGTAVIVSLSRTGRYGELLQADRELRWDADGYIWAIPEETDLQDQSRENVERVLRSEAEQYAQWSAGHVYGYEIKRGEEHVDSLWGLYGFDYAISQAQEVITNELHD